MMKMKMAYSKKSFGYLKDKLMGFSNNSTLFLWSTAALFQNVKLVEIIRPVIVENNS